MLKPISAAKPMLPATPVRVVIVTMDSHLSGAVERANRILVKQLPGLSLSVHAAAEWADDAGALERCRDAIAEGDVVITTMLFMEDHFTPVLPALAARRDH